MNALGKKFNRRMRFQRQRCALASAYTTIVSWPADVIKTHSKKAKKRKNVSG